MPNRDEIVEKAQKQLAGCPVSKEGKHCPEFVCQFARAVIEMDLQVQQLQFSVEQYEAGFLENNKEMLLARPQSGEYIQSDPRPRIQQLEAQLAGEQAAYLLEHERAEKLVKQLAEARKVIAQYADKANWKCPRCGHKDQHNCFMGQWTGPVSEGELSEYAIDAHGWFLADRFLKEAERG